MRNRIGRSAEEDALDDEEQQAHAAEMLAITSKEFWEIVDRGTNFDYLSDERKQKLREFFAGFSSLSASAAE